MAKYKIILRVAAVLFIFAGGVTLGSEATNIMQQIYYAVSGIGWFVLACAMLLF